MQVLSEVKQEVLKPSSCTELISVPSFLLKAYDIVADCASNDIVRWTDEGDAFIITNKNKFSDKVLPIYFKHKNLASFIRQLNIYGFKKTKYKSEEHCFAHKDFKRDNKLLLLNMKRNAKVKHSDRKSQNSDVSTYMRKSEVMTLFDRMNERITLQDDKIESLMKANQEFKNSVLALYTQLEKSKEREKYLEKSIVELTPFAQNQQSNTLLNEELTDQLKEKFKNESTYRLNNSDLFGLFTSFLKQFMQKLNTKDCDNIYYENKRKYEYYSRGSPPPGSRKIYTPMDIQKYNRTNMLENTPYYDTDHRSQVKLDIFSNPLKSKDSRVLQQSSLLDNEPLDLWDKISEAKSNPEPNNMGIIEQLESVDKDKNNYLYNCSQSILSDIDIDKDRSMDNLSVGSNRKFSDILNGHENKISLCQPLPFLNPSGNQFEDHKNKDMSDCRSVSSFSSEHKMCGMKRQRIS